MKPKTHELIPIFVVILVVIGFVLALVFRNSAKVEEQVVNATDNAEIVVVQEYFAEANSFSGEITTPTPCHNLVMNAEVNSNTPEEIRLMLTTEQESEVCVQQLAEKDFEIVIPSSPDARLVAVELNGHPVNFKINKN